MSVAIYPPEPHRLGIESVLPISIKFLSVFPIIIDDIYPGGSIKNLVCTLEEVSMSPGCTIGDAGLAGYGDINIYSSNVGTSGINLALHA